MKTCPPGCNERTTGGIAALDSLGGNSTLAEALVCFTVPGCRNDMMRGKGGAYSLLSQVAIGSAYNVVSEFSLDILHKFGIKKGVKPTE